MANTTSPLSIKLDVEVRERLAALATQEKRTSHALARDAILAMVTESEARNALAREAQDAWVHYQETGLHLSLEEVADWMSGWGTADEKPIPKCHV